MSSEMDCRGRVEVLKDRSGRFEDAMNSAHGYSPRRERLSTQHFTISFLVNMPASQSFLLTKQLLLSKSLAFAANSRDENSFLPITDRTHRNIHPSQKPDRPLLVLRPTKF
jgi:hypothetical protein